VIKTTKISGRVTRTLEGSKNDQYDEFMSYYDILNLLKKKQQQEVLRRFKRITGHQGPQQKADLDYCGSMLNLQVEWENGEVSYTQFMVRIMNS
jgi:hypothetical protein